MTVVYKPLKNNHIVLPEGYFRLVSTYVSLWAFFSYFPEVFPYQRCLLGVLGSLGTFFWYSHGESFSRNMDVSMSPSTMVRLVICLGHRIQAPICMIRKWG